MKTDVAEAAAEPEPETGHSRKPIIILLLFMGVMGALWAIGPLVFASHDDPTAIDNKTVRTAVSAGCTQLLADLAAVPRNLPPAERADAENRAVDGFLGRIRALGPDTLAKDNPVDKWLADWDHILATRRQAAREGRHFATPMVDGAPINVRMFALVRSGLEKCDVPKQLLTPEPGQL